MYLLILYLKECGFCTVHTTILLISRSILNVLCAVCSHENGHENEKENGLGNGQDYVQRNENKHGQGKIREINQENLVF